VDVAQQQLEVSPYVSFSSENMEWTKDTIASSPKSGLNVPNGVKDEAYDGAFSYDKAPARYDACFGVVSLIFPPRNMYLL